MSLILSPDQDKALSAVLEWWNQVKDIEDFSTCRHLQTFSMGGYAGTGKSTVLAFLSKELGQERNIQFVSLTGKAVNVINSKLQKEHLPATASTIHSLIYAPVVDDKGQIKEWVNRVMAEQGETPEENEIEFIDLFINDEASMTSEDLNDDLLSYNRPILYVGDHGQLPPVKGNLNLMANPRVRLETLHRNAGPIAELAYLARQGKQIPYGWRTDKVARLKVNELSHPDIDWLVANPGKQVMLLVAKNATRLSWNKRIREIYFDHQPDLPDAPIKGDWIMFWKNQKRSGIYNGMSAKIISIKFQQEHPEFNYSITAEAEDGRILQNIPVYRHAFNTEKVQVEPSMHWRNFGLPADFGYTMTCHKAQGSEAPRVLVYGQGFGDFEMRKRWLYTAITRSSEYLYLVN